MLGGKTPEPGGGRASQPLLTYLGRTEALLPQLRGASRGCPRCGAAAAGGGGGAAGVAARPFASPRTGSPSSLPSPPRHAPPLSPAGGFLPEIFIPEAGNLILRALTRQSPGCGEPARGGRRGGRRGRASGRAAPSCDAAGAPPGGSPAGQPRPRRRGRDGGRGPGEGRGRSARGWGSGGLSGRPPPPRGLEGRGAPG